MSREQQIAELLRPVVEDLGYEFVGALYRANPGSGLLRVYIDREGGIGVDDCARVSREVSALLDVNDPIAGHYNLEVSSPGLHRPLFTLAHFQRFIGHQAKVTVAVPMAGRRRFKGPISAVEQDDIVMEVDGQEVRIAHGNVVKARLAPEF